ncbi:MAG: NUDIX hydrolase [Pseudomonadota bacterium]
MSQEPAPAKPSASVVITRDQGANLEVLLLRRNEKIVFHGGAWVFPGGRVDDADHAGLDDELEIAKVAAVREVSEETGLTVTPDGLRPFAHWTTPIQLPKRFATWFFVAGIPKHLDVQIDNSEIIDFKWLTASAALSAHRNGEISLPGPTFVTLRRFESITTTEALLQEAMANPVERFEPRIVKLENGRCALYREDAGYDGIDMDIPGPRHRLVMAGTDWAYERDF